MNISNKKNYHFKVVSLPFTINILTTVFSDFFKKLLNKGVIFGIGFIKEYFLNVKINHFEICFTYKSKNI